MAIFGIDNLTIPNRFESLLENPYLKFEPLIVPVTADMQSLLGVRDRARVQHSGILTFLLGGTGVGKTTAVYSLAVHAPDEFEPVFSVPATVGFREAAAWLAQSLPQAKTRMLPVLFDGREVTDDAVGLRQFMSSLNQLLRRRQDVLFVWPTTDTEWHRELHTLAQKIGGSSLAPDEASMTIDGPPKDDWPDVLNRILIQYDFTLDDAALEQMTVDAARDSTPTVGEFLRSIGGTVAERTTREREIKGLPSLVFAVTSGTDVAGEANRIRRAGSYILKAEELLAYSPRSESGKWWKAKSVDPQHHLAYIISLFDARLTTLTPSAVAYSCLHFGAEDLQEEVKAKGLVKHISNAGVTMKSADFYRFLAEETTSELTSSRKGKTRDASMNAFKTIQALSAERHKDINTAIVKHLGTVLDTADFSSARFEVDAGDQNLYTDAIVSVAGVERHLEFHHLSPAQCKASKMAAYIMGKLSRYAIHHNLIPR